MNIGKIISKAREIAQYISAVITAIKAAKRKD